MLQLELYMLKLPVYLSDFFQSRSYRPAATSKKKHFGIYGQYLDIVFCTYQQVYNHTKHVGIYGQWIDTWNPAPDSREIAVILEDDLTVSKHFYLWLINVHRKYDDRTDLAGYALQGRSMKHGGAAGNLRGPDKDVCFMYPILGICSIQD